MKGVKIYLTQAIKKNNDFEILTTKGMRFVRFYDPLSYAPDGYIINSDFSIRIFLNFPFMGDSHSYITYSLLFIMQKCKVFICLVLLCDKHLKRTLIL